ncbi:MAG TPA: PBP1A family penicillin-binding protein, partial [Candidatus Acidoferrales bacterium]|nr:PBP1A family penicillin-binding protein [Candidatus Acidoferrales bacterium]
SYYYVKYDRIITDRMSGRIFNTSAKIYARPQLVRPGDKLTTDQIATELRRAGYVEEGIDSRLGTFRLSHSSIEIHPGPESFHSADPAVIRVTGGAVESISTSTGGPLDGYELEPELVTALFEGQQRTKRQLVRYDDLPKVMVDAVLAIEDRKFFEHSGVNWFSVMNVAVQDLLHSGKRRGASTITMQVSRGFFLTPERSIKRKLTEMLIAMELEHKFTKKQIFELYANQEYMGQRGSFSINGFGEASRAYFGKDIREITLPEAAMLAGLIQSPNNLWNPYKRPERAMERRNVVLESMVETGAITREQCDRAKATPLKLAPLNVEASDAPYFVDLVKDQLSAKYKEQELNENAYRIYTTLDPELQRAAADAVDAGIKLVDEQVKKQRTHKKKIGTGKNATVETTVENGPTPQVALVAIDPHTGDVLAMVGGRNYGFSQLDHAVAKRPTGSIFKPFVYAAAMNTGVLDANDPNQTPGTYFTPVSMVDDSPTTFTYGSQIYEPRNYQNEYFGQVTARFALMKSLNNATVKLAEMVGYDKVAALARAAGISSVQPTPAMALGSYDASPLDMAGAYTVFANAGVHLDPQLLRSVRTSTGDIVEDFKNSPRPVLDPRVSYVMTTMMESVINNGTGAGVRARGFSAPAAGKTGTSHDAWFAGYTTNLLCIVWVGYDDYSDLKLSGGSTAAPIWAEFMKRAVALPQYHNTQEFTAPSGVVDLTLDKSTNLVATAGCPDDYSIAFISGTEPRDTCDHADQRNIFQKILGIGQPPQPVPAEPAPLPSANVPPRRPMTRPPVQVPTQAQSRPAPPPAPAPEKKKGFWGKVWGSITGSGDSDQQKSK